MYFLILKLTTSNCLPLSSTIDSFPFASSLRSSMYWYLNSCLNKKYQLFKASLNVDG